MQEGDQDVSSPCTAPPGLQIPATPRNEDKLHRRYTCGLEEIQNEALYRACRAHGLGEQFLAAAQDEGTFGEWLDELPFEVAAATARLLKHHARSGAWVELSPGNPSQASRAGRDRDRSSPNCPSDMSELSENSD